MKCWAEQYCKGYPKLCNQFCDAYVLLEIYYKHSNIPLRYQYPQELIVEKEDKPIYEAIGKIIENVGEWVEEGNSLYLFGKNKGTGKTSLACAIANAYIRYRVKNNPDLGPVVYFIKTAKFLEEIRLQFNNPTPDFPSKLELIENVELLIMDDIGAEKPSDWVRERLLNVIDQRYSNMKSTIYTSNLSIVQLAENLHDRIADRLRDCTILEFKGNSKRGMK